jgi:hypothetical protein
MHSRFGAIFRGPGVGILLELVGSDALGDPPLPADMANIGPKT